MDGNILNKILKDHELIEYLEAIVNSGCEINFFIESLLQDYCKGFISLEKLMGQLSIYWEYQELQKGRIISC